MKTSELAFIGIKGSVVALIRATGEQVWATHLKGSYFVNVVVQDGTVLASCYGGIFCLDPVWSKSSCGLSVVKLEQPAEALAGANSPSPLAHPVR